jgi:hypothetical protein
MLKAATNAQASKNLKILPRKYYAMRSSFQTHRSIDLDIQVDSVTSRQQFHVSANTWETIYFENCLKYGQSLMLPMMTIMTIFSI